MNDSSSRMTIPERKVVEYLRKMNIEWVYEQLVFVGIKTISHVLGI